MTSLNIPAQENGSAKSRYIWSTNDRARKIEFLEDLIQKTEKLLAERKAQEASQSKK